MVIGYKAFPNDNIWRRLGVGVRVITITLLKVGVSTCWRDFGHVWSISAIQIYEFYLLKYTKTSPESIESILYEYLFKFESTLL